MKNLNVTYLIALTIIALTISISQFLVQRSISFGASDSRTINISGRQRMLSQKITKSALAMSQSKTQEEFENRKKELRNSILLLSKSHEGLQFGDQSMNLVDVNNSDDILELFGLIAPYYEAIKSATGQILTVTYFQEAKNEEFDELLTNILANEPKFLEIMNKITFEYDSESSERVSSLSKIEYLLFGIALVLLMLEGLLIFRPAMKRIELYTKKILKQKEDLKTALNREEYLNNQAQSVFDNVKQGVFLLDKDLMISDFYSKETEEIFDSQELANTNFLRLMSSRLLKRDLDALQMFVENLFNPDIKEYVVNKLNPVDKVELYNGQNEADLAVRHIKMSFSRIMDQNEIHRVLVTITDETESVLMRKQIEAAEEKNKQESNQLMAILKVNPKLLKVFLSNSIEVLETISKEYESFNGDSYENLINDTFNSVHNVKGNATLIGLQIIEDKMHIVEESIFALRTKSQVQGKDFLKVVYEITEVISILQNMDELLNRLADVYSNIKEAPSTDPSNSLLINSLRRGIEKMGNEYGKSLQFVFDHNDISLPQEYLLDVKDIAIQLSKNSIVHGIEPAEERLQKGKPVSATIRLALRNTEDGISIVYEDDGRGLDSEKVIRKALKKGLINRQKLDSISPEEISPLVFEDDFSTADEVNQMAGRGQGLSLVKSITEKNNGSVNASFEKGRFFRIEITFPTES